MLKTLIAQALLVALCSLWPAGARGADIEPHERLVASVHALCERVEEGDGALRRRLGFLLKRLEAERKRIQGEFGASDARCLVALYRGYAAIDDLAARKRKAHFLEALEPSPRPNERRLVPEIAVVERGRPRGRLIALTFDDGPIRNCTSRILDVLARYDVRATFFVVGAQVRAKPELMRRIVEAGHAVGHHSYSHPKFGRLPTWRIRREWRKTDAALKTALGKPSRVRLFRLPYNSGIGSKKVHRVLSERFDYIVGWSIDSEDYKIKSPRKVADRVLRNSLKKGAIVLFHDHGHATAQALDLIIPSLIDQGFRFVTVPELIGTQDNDAARRVFVRALRNLERGRAKRCFYDLIWLAKEFPDCDVADSALYFAFQVAQTRLNKVRFATKLQAYLRAHYPRSPLTTALGGATPPAGSKGLPVELGE